MQSSDGNFRPPASCCPAPASSYGSLPTLPHAHDPQPPHQSDSPPDMVASYHFRESSTAHDSGALVVPPPSASTVETPSPHPHADLLESPKKPRMRTGSTTSSTRSRNSLPPTTTRVKTSPRTSPKIETRRRTTGPSSPGPPTQPSRTESFASTSSSSASQQSELNAAMSLGGGAGAGDILGGVEGAGIPGSISDGLSGITGSGTGKSGPIAPNTEDEWCDLLANYVSQNLLTRSNYFIHDFSSAAHHGGSGTGSNSHSGSGSSKRKLPKPSPSQRPASLGVFSPGLVGPRASSPMREAREGAVGNSGSRGALGLVGVTASGSKATSSIAEAARTKADKVFWEAPYAPGDISRAHSGQAKIEHADLRKNSVEPGGVGAGTGIALIGDKSGGISRRGSRMDQVQVGREKAGRSRSDGQDGKVGLEDLEKGVEELELKDYFDGASVPPPSAGPASESQSATPHVSEIKETPSENVKSSETVHPSTNPVIPPENKGDTIRPPSGSSAKIRLPRGDGFDFAQLAGGAQSQGSGGSGESGVNRISMATASRNGSGGVVSGIKSPPDLLSGGVDDSIGDPWLRANARVATDNAELVATGRAPALEVEDETFQDPLIPDMAGATQEQPIDAYKRRRKRTPVANAESAKSRRTLARRLGQPQVESAGAIGVGNDDPADSVTGTRQSTIRAPDSTYTAEESGVDSDPPEMLQHPDPFAPSSSEQRPAIIPLQDDAAQDTTLRPDEPVKRKPLLSRPSFAVAPSVQEDREDLMASSKGSCSPTPSFLRTSQEKLDAMARLNKHRDEAQYIKGFFETQGFMPAPQQSPETTRRRLRTIRRLGLDSDGDAVHRTTLDRFTRLACSIFKAKMATVTIVGQNNQLFPSEIGLNVRTMGLELGFCTHTSLSAREAMIVPDAAEDWRFRNHPMVQNGKGPIRFYAGAPLTFGEGSKTCTIGTLCVIDDKPRHNWSSHDSAVLIDLASCVLGDMELMFEERQKELRSVMHQVTVDFLRQSLRGPPARRQIRERSRNHPSTDASSAELESFKEGAENRPGSSHRGSVTTGEHNNGIDLYQEACNVIMHTLNAHAVAIVDLSRFHIYFPSAQEDGANTERGTGTATGTSGTGGSRTNSTRQSNSAYTTYMSSEAHSATSSSSDPNRARAMHGDAESRKIPIVEFVRRQETPSSLPSTTPSDTGEEQIHVLGQAYSGSELQFNFNTTTAHRTIANFIVQHLATRRVWYERNDSPQIAASLTVMMPVGTEVSLTLPVFDFQGQAAFCVAVCWSDPLYTYDKAAISFVENISGSLLANTLRTRLSVMEQSQRAFAAFASHQWRTPLHQMMTTTSLMRQLLAYTPPATPAPRGGEYFDRPMSAHQIQVAQKNQELALMLDTLESSGRSLQDTLSDILDFLDVGSDTQGKQADGGINPQASDGDGMEMDALMADAIMDAQSAEIMLRNASGRDARQLETICEVVPRSTGDWMILRDFGPLKRACNKIISNSYAATTSGFVSVVVEDVTHRATIPLGYDRTLTKSIVRVTIEDSGSGMNPAFVEKEIFRPFAKEDKFSPGSGLGVTLTQRILLLMGGVIRFTTQPGKGTTCVIEVPLFIQDLPDGMTDNLTPGDGLPPIAVLGFDGQSDVGLSRVSDSLRRQLRAAGCEVVPHYDGASLFVCEESYDVLSAHPELANRNPADVKVIMVGSAVSPRKNNLDNPTELGDTAIGLSWLFRPLLPGLIEKILAICRTSALKDETEKAQILPSPRLSAQSDGDVSPTTSSLGHSQAHREPPSPLPRPEEDPIPKTDGGASLTIPPADPSEDPGPSRSRRGSAEQPMFTVLVVEDNPINRRLLVGMIKRMKITCFEAVDGAQAVTRYIESRPSLVLLDINMPIKNGFEAASDIRKHERQHLWPRCKIIAVTALSAERDKRRGMIESGIDDWVTKPVGVQNLKSSIEALRATRGKMDQDDRDERG